MFMWSLCVLPRPLSCVHGSLCALLGSLSCVHVVLVCSTTSSVMCSWVLVCSTRFSLVCSCGSYVFYHVLSRVFMWSLCVLPGLLLKEMITNMNATILHTPSQTDQRTKLFMYSAVSDPFFRC